MLFALIQTMRPKQWAKNLLLFAGMVFDRKLTNLPAFLVTLQGFALFCLLASSIYIINDLSDIEADRQHPLKRQRPIPSGRLPIPVAWAAALLFAGLAVGLGFQLSTGFGLAAATYLLLNLLYSRWFKHIVVIDVIVLAAFYVLRVAAGVTLVDVERFSPWLYVFTTFLALFLGIGKRRAEINTLAEGVTTRRVLEGYTASFLDQLLQVVLTLAILTYSLYTFSAPNLPSNNAMMLTIPFVIYGFFRYLYLVEVDKSGEAPEEILFSDRAIQATLVLWGLTVLGIFYIF